MTIGKATAGDAAGSVSGKSKLANTEQRRIIDVDDLHNPGFFGGPLEETINLPAPPEEAQPADKTDSEAPTLDKEGFSNTAIANIKQPASPSNVRVANQTSAAAKSPPPHQGGTNRLSSSYVWTAHSPRGISAGLSLPCALLMAVIGYVLGAKASSIPEFWLVNVLSDTLFAITVAATVEASQWVFEAILKRRINRGQETPVFLTEKLGGLPMLKNGPLILRCLALLMLFTGLAQLLADTGLDAKLVPVSKGYGLIWVAHNDCPAKTGYDIMRDGPAGASGLYARSVVGDNEILKKEDMPLALLARDIYSGRVPDNGGKVNRVVSNAKFLNGDNTVYYSEDKRPIMEMPLTIPVIEVEVEVKAEFYDSLTQYKGPAYETFLDGVAMDEIVTNKLWAVVLHEDLGDDFFEKLTDVLDMSFPHEFSEDWNGYSYQFPTVGSTARFRILVAIQETVEDFFASFDFVARQLEGVPIPKGASATHLFNIQCTQKPDKSGNDCIASGAWTIITEHPLPVASFWPISEGAVPADGDSLGKGGTVVEDLARVVHASLLVCGEATTGPVGEREVRAVVKAQWLITYLGLWIYILVCISAAIWISRKEPFVPLPKSWYDGYQMALSDSGAASAIGSRYCDDPFLPTPQTNKGMQPLYNISDGGRDKNNDRLGLTHGNVVPRRRPLHP